MEMLMFFIALCHKTTTFEVPHVNGRSKAKKINRTEYHNQYSNHYIPINCLVIPNKFRKKRQIQKKDLTKHAQM